MGEIATKTDQMPALSTAQQILQMASALATNKDADVGKLREMMAMAREAEQAELEALFNDAMAQAQTEMGRISTNQNNTQTSSRYADYAALDKALRPIYTKHGFAVSFTTGETAKPETVRVVALLSRGGYTREYHIDMPADGKGPKGGEVMSRTHATGAATTYGRRYLLTMIFNLAVEDTDGNMPGTAITQEQADTLKKMNDDLAFEVDGPNADYAAWLKAFLDHMKVATVEEIQAKNFGRAKDAIAATRKARMKK